MKKVLLLLLIAVSQTLPAQTVKTYFKQNKVGVHSTSLISYLGKKGYFVDHDDTGFYVLDITNQKPILVRSKQGVNANERQFITAIGVFKNKFYFMLEYTVGIPPDGHRFGIWSFDGEKMAATEIAREWYKQDAILIFKGINIAKDYIYFTVLPASAEERGGRLPLVGTRFDGTTTEPISSEGVPGDYGNVPRCYIKNNALTTTIIPDYSDDRKGTEYQYDGKKWVKGAAVGHVLTYHTNVCGQEIQGFAGNGENIALKSELAPGKTLFEMEPSQQIEGVTFIHNDKLVFGYREDPESRELGPKDGLYISDGTVEGTRMFTQKSFLDRRFDKRILSFSSYGNMTYFVVLAFDRVKQKDMYRLWQTDGTDAGTKILFASETALGKVINAKGVPVYAKFYTPRFAQLYKFADGKETPLVDVKTNTSAIIIADSMLNLEEQYGSAPEGTIVLLSGAYEGGFSVSMIDPAPAAKYTPLVCQTAVR